MLYYDNINLTGLGQLPEVRKLLLALALTRHGLDSLILVASTWLHKQKHLQLREQSAPGRMTPLWVAGEAEGCQEAKEGPRWL